MSIILPSFAGIAKPSGGGGAAYSNTLSGLFDGNDTVEMSNINLTGAKAVSLWVKIGGNMISGGGNGAVLIGGTDDYYVNMAYSQYLYIRGTNNSGAANSIQYIALGANFYQENAWHHICISSDGTTLTYYVDGVAKGTDPNVDPVNVNAIGGRSVSYHQSNLDEIALFDSALSQAQVTNIYRGEEDGGTGGTDGTPGDLSTFSPLHWWRFGDGTGDLDASGNAPANTYKIATLVDQGSGNKNATQTNATNQPTFSNVLPS